MVEEAGGCRGVMGLEGGAEDLRADREIHRGR